MATATSIEDLRDDLLARGWVLQRNRSLPRYRFVVGKSPNDASDGYTENQQRLQTDDGYPDDVEYRFFIEVGRAWDKGSHLDVWVEAGGGRERNRELVRPGCSKLKLELFSSFSSSWRKSGQ
ncbi:hypothetical protein DCS_07163 [Drechmeria coniospora]|uniref:Uncharacterized protein n=1 Tax=Drechmeria coniospora TaxID=98403 RepID=A0A151GDR6_DRECN|nr:hypothetical protein DCS_07163 [Drechmeria coniospora]KYK55201.1 hypothetical protein DCS_07163 [Drechmeria coniospora]